MASNITLVPSNTASAIGVSTASATTPASSSSSSDDPDQANEPLLEIYNLIVLGVVVTLLIASLPRAIARFNHPGALRSGWLLKHRKSYVRRATEAIRRSLHLGPPGPQTQPTAREGPVEYAIPYATADSDEGRGSQGEHVLPIRRVYRRGEAVAPAHVQSWSTLLHPMSVPFNMPFFATGFSNAQVLLYVAYLAMFVTFGFVMTSGSVSVGRAGWLVVGNLPLVVALGSKNSIIGAMVGSHYGKLNFIHRFIGRLMFVASLYHVLGFLIIWLTQGTIDEAGTQAPAWAAFSGLVIVTVSSLPFVRRSAYNLFFHAHWVGYMTLLIAVCFHVDGAVFWTIGAVCVLVLDHVCRLVKSNVVTASVTAMPDFGATRVEIPQLTHGWRAGQHVRVRTLSSKMGIGAFFEAHPFTIASVSENVGGEGVVLYIKKTGDWTKKLYTAADYGAPPPKLDEKTSIETLGDDEPLRHRKLKVEKGFGSGGTMKMLVEGPYGGPGHAMVSSFSSAFVIVGGSGITFGLVYVEEMIRDAEAVQTRIRMIHLVWVVQDPSSFIPLLHNLLAFVKRTAHIPAISLKITVHYTRAASASFSKKLKDRTIRTLLKDMDVRPGRPQVSEYLSSFVDATNTIARGRSGLNGVAVLTCGPAGLVDDARAAVASITAETKNSVGGIEFIEEAFAW